jgi:16S rRNA (adenine1518-N6/adenine1519-N6)-dimethyltransferase
MRKRKALGQHFLASRSVLKKIIDVISPQKDELIVEIGAGKGALTFPLAERCARVIAIEKDKSLARFLLENRRDNLIVLEEDVLRTNFRELLAREQRFRGKTKLVGNLPYVISSPLLFKVLEEKGLFSRCVFLLQKEVAERIIAHPGSKTYAPLSILFQMDYETRLHFIIAPGSFSPPPQVQSALVSLERRPGPLFPVKNKDIFHGFLRTAFAKRRKTLINNLKSYLFPLPLIKQALARLSLEENVRAEQVSIAQFVSLFEFLSGSFPEVFRDITKPSKSTTQKGDLSR